ncbi:HAMP domain-containing protein [Nonomuraea phyllanthi]|uniref:histidine kinase n=1 Tax=Nonomuraea phyllanthi TaxID=2219224 RepID=A0A5C4WU39_9ACTN|nr:nitrate- and nitrite sensing domain-containing protein [Nonomuraea phyllanthi]KAB8197119.1 HAMP domain-containing protein [Nonomuraea phyllanthi]
MSTELDERQASSSSWRLSNWRVRARLVALILIPTAAAVLLGGIQVLARTSAAADYARTNQLAQLSTQLGALTHQVAGERARTSWYIARGRPASSLPAVRSQMEQVDKVAAQVRGTVRQLLDDAGGRTADQLENLISRLDDLKGLREQALDATLLPGPAVELYTTVIGDLLSVHNELVKDNADDELFRRTRMLNALARAKESVSYQQALVTVVLTEGAFDPDQLERFLGEQSKETNERRAYAAEATADERRLFDETVNGRSADRMLFLRELVLIRATEGLRLRGLDLSKRDDAKEWFDATDIVVDAMRKVEERQTQDIVARSQALSDDERRQALVTAGAVLALLVAVLLVTTGVARSLVRPLRRLRGEALEIAGRRLPDFVQHLRESRDGAVEAEVPPIGIFSKDEVGEVARAFDEVHREAVRLAGDEAKLRANVNAMFVNLSRRSQTLVERQLTLIEKLERGERDDTRLGDLFRLDHLATRMRRNSENLLVLAGQEAARKWSEPVELMDIVRAALGEVESYDRVSIQVQSDVAIAGQAVTDVVHLLAELIENAVSFSSRDTKVIISSSRIDGGSLMLSATDHGIGMSPEELSEANWRLANPPVVDVSVSRRMGLFVVGRLALRHGIRVQLRRQDTGGLTAMVLVPPALLTEVPGTAPAPQRAQVPPQANGRMNPQANGRLNHQAHPLESSAPFPGQYSESFPAPFPEPFPEPFPGPSSEPYPGPGADPFSEQVPGPFAEPYPGHVSAEHPSAGHPSSGHPSFATLPPAASMPGHPSLDGPPSAPEPSSWFTSSRTHPAEPSPPPQDSGLPGDAYPSFATPSPAGGRDDHYPSFATPSPAAGKDDFLPIYAAVEESGWFTKAAPTADHRDTAWTTPADQGWQAAGAAAEPVQNGTTGSGLPKRTPRANLVPGTANPKPPPAPVPAISPDQLRSRLASYQQGVRKGRAELEEDQ